MSADQRRSALINDIYLKGETTVSKLADDHGVSTRTIMRDMDYLSLIYPIRLVRGRGGGIKLLKSDYLKSAEHKVKERAVLNNILIQHEQKGYCKLEKYELIVINKMVQSIVI